MIITYSQNDLVRNIPFAQENIVTLNVVRSLPFNYTKIKNYCRNIDAQPGSKTLRHYIPFQRIWLAIHEGVSAQRPTRLQLVNGLTQVLNALNIREDAFLGTYASDMTIRQQYDTYIDYAINALCYYQDNLYYGPGTGDEKGVKIDVPNGDRKDAQLKRVKAGANRLKQALQVAGWNLDVTTERVPIKEVAGSFMDDGVDDDE